MRCDTVIVESPTRATTKGSEMTIFAVTYDLIKGKDYERLWTELERLEGHKALASFYLLNLEIDDTPTLKNHLKMFVDADDLLMVVKVEGRPSFVKAKAGTTDWINQNCP